MLKKIRRSFPIGRGTSVINASAMQVLYRCYAGAKAGLKGLLHASENSNEGTNEQISE